LLLDPVQKLVTSGILKTVWPLLAEPVRKRARGKLRRFKTLTLAELIEGNAAAAQAVQRYLDTANAQKRKKKSRNHASNSSPNQFEFGRSGGAPPMRGQFCKRLTKK
jgi:hypothetical protein